VDLVAAAAAVVVAAAVAAGCNGWVVADEYIEPVELS